MRQFISKTCSHRISYPFMYCQSLSPRTSTLGLLVHSAGLSHWMEQTSSEATTSSLEATTKFLHTTRIPISKFIYTFSRNHRIRHLRTVVVALQQSHRTTCTSSARLPWLGSLHEMPSSPSKPSLVHQLIHRSLACLPRQTTADNHLMNAISKGRSLTCRGVCRL